MIDDPITVAFGLGVAAVGALLWMLGARRPDFVPSSEQEQSEFDFLDRRASRRVKVSLGFILCGGLLIASGLVDAAVHPRTSLLLALASLPIIAWAILMAVGDWTLSHRRATQQLRSVESQREQMERAIERYRDRGD